MAYETLLVDIRDHVGVITLNQPETRNALSALMLREIAAAAAKFDADDMVGAMVITGDAKTFSVGSDVSELRDKTYVEMFRSDMGAGDWATFERVRKPIVAAVSGHALGGGCELALACDIVLAAPTAKFGLPDVNLGVMPGAGGAQRLARVVGKAKAMEMCLTGRSMGAEEAERSGLVSRLVAADDLLDDAVATASKISEKSRLAALALKETINLAYETSLSDGVRFERRLFQALFSTEDQSEGMAAFLEDRTPQFRGR